MSAFVANLSEAEWMMVQVLSAAIIVAGVALVLWMMGASANDSNDV